MAVVPDVTGGLVAELAGLRELDPQVLAEGDTIVALHEQLAILQAVVTRAVAAFDAGRSWEADGARSAASWVGTRCKLPTPVSRHRVRLGRDLRHMPEVEKAWVAGEINEFHVSLLVRARARNPEAFRRDEELLTGEAKRWRYVHFVKVITYWMHLADPDGAEERAEQAHARRRYHHSKGFEGLWFADGIFDAVGGAIFDKVLREIYDELFQQDWTEAKARVGEGVTVSDLARTPAQRRADAVVEMARRAGAMPEGARKPEPLFTVVVGYDRFARACELWEGTVVTPGQLGPWLDAGLGGARGLRRREPGDRRR